jgi:hypothetical protein
VIAPASIAQRLAASRLVGLPGAIEAALKPLFLGVTVRQHPGRIDISDLLEKDMFKAPMIAVALTRWRGPLAVDGSWRIDVECAAFVVTEDMALAGKRVPRQEVAHAISHGLLEVLSDFDVPRWGLQAITLPERAEARPLFTSETFAKGAAYYVVSWEQALVGLGTDPLARALVSSVEAVWDGAAEPIDDGGPA